MRLIKMGNGRFKVLNNAVTFEGDWMQVKKYMTLQAEVPAIEFDMACEQMEARKHDVVVFDVLTGELKHTCLKYEQQSVIDELQAIQTVKLELVSVKSRYGLGREAKETFDRLVSLCITLNVDKALRVIHGSDEAAAEVKVA